MWLGLVPALLWIQLSLAEVLFVEEFGPGWESRWVQSDKAQPGDQELGTFVSSAGEWYADPEKDKGLRTQSNARFYHLSTTFPLVSAKEGLVVQFSVKHPPAEEPFGQVTGQHEPKDFDGDTPYLIMFGPDICGATRKVHAILGHKGRNVELTKHMDRCKYSLMSQVDWEDNKDITDPTDQKPSDWDDEPGFVADPDASQPEDWLPEEDGPWHPPRLPNPKHIVNPKYTGSWEPRHLPNPKYVPDPTLHAFEGLGGVGFDIWQVNAGTIFDNIVIATSVEDVLPWITAWQDTKYGERKMFDRLEVVRKRREDREATARRARDGPTEPNDGTDDQ
eukprot:gene10380-1881_t